MVVFKTQEEFETYLAKQTMVAVENTRDKIEKVIDKYLRKYYGEYQPEMYLRTSHLLNSLIKTPVTKNGNEIRASVYFDANALNYSDKVMAYVGGGREIPLSAKPNPEATLESAMTGKTHGGHKIKGGSTPIWTKSEKELGNIVALIAKELKDAGIPVK